jgi:hypothetical protein
MSRVEALAMLGEGVSASTIEQATLQARYPAPALALADEQNLELLRRVRNASRQSSFSRIDQAFVADSPRLTWRGIFLVPTPIVTPTARPWR